MAAVQHLHVGWTVLLLVLCIAPLTFYVHIFRPCWDCSDFESTAVRDAHCTFSAAPSAAYMY